MDTPERLQSWLKLMGYQGKMPTDFKPFCNPSTAFIWEQLIQTVKPKGEVARVRNTLLINRCTSSVSDVDTLRNEFKLPIRELELWKKRQSLKENVGKVQEEIIELKSDVDELAKFNQIQHLKVETVRKRIRRTRNRSHILNRKRRQLEVELAEVRELSARVSSLTPVEGDVEDASEVADTLRQCALHLERVIETDAKRRSEQADLSDELSLMPALACSSFKEDVVGGTALDSTILKDGKLEGLVESLFKYNRHDVWEDIRGENEIRTRVLMDNVANSFVQIKKEGNSNTITPNLYGAHIELELDTIRVRCNIAKLEAEISTMNVNDADTNAKEYGLMKAIQHLRKLINDSHTNGAKYSEVKDDLVRVDKEIAVVFEDVRKSRDLFEQVYRTVQQISANSGKLAKKLGKYTSDNDWLHLLSASTSSTEVETFLNYPLRSETGYGYDSNKPQLAVSLFKSVWSPPEVTLIIVIRAKEKLQFLKSLAYKFDVGEIDAVDLQRQESYVSYALDKLKHLILSRSGLSQTNKELRETVELWLNMPMRKFVSQNRLFDLFPYAHYEELYEQFYKQL